MRCEQKRMLRSNNIPRPLQPLHMEFNGCFLFRKQLLHFTTAAATDAAAAPDEQPLAKCSERRRQLQIPKRQITISVCLKSQVTSHTSHVTHHTSHITRQTSHERTGCSSGTRLPRPAPQARQLARATLRCRVACSGVSVYLKYSLHRQSAAARRRGVHRARQHSSVIGVTERRRRRVC